MRGAVVAAALGVLVLCLWPGAARAYDTRFFAGLDPGMPREAADPAVAPPSLDALNGTLTPMLAGWAGNYAVTITDLQTGQTTSLNGARPQSAASTIKLPIVMLAARDVAEGRYPRSTIDDLVHDTMAVSDNAAARALLVRAGDGSICAGVRRVNDLMRELGATGSVLSSPPGYPGDDCGLSYDNLLTTDDLNRMLARLYAGRALPAEATAYVLQAMALPEGWQNGSLGAPLPEGVRFLHKPGWLGDTWNDAGIVVFSRNGRDYAYAIAYMATRTSGMGIAYDRGRSVAAAAWAYFDAAYPGVPLRRFPETGHAVANGFLAYWDRFGGLAVFGYPLTDEITENGLTVQYFERARFEWHPDVAPDRYDVLLGLLGREVTRGRGAETAFQPAPPRPGCRAFTETGHNLCAGFRQYWERFGGLATYGLPISEEFVEGGTVVQYFERARFEWHPGAAPDRYDVLLGRLGAELLAKPASWQTTSAPPAIRRPRIAGRL